MKQRPLILLCLTLVGLVLSYLSEHVLPLGYGVTVLWLGVVVIVNGSLWFGAWGILAGIVFPFLAGQLNGLAVQDSLMAIIPNLLDGLIPALAFRSCRADPALQDRRSLKLYLIWGAVLPSALSGVLAAGSWLVLDKVDAAGFRLLALDWSLSNMAVLIVFGIPAATLLTPIFRDKGWLVAGWWR